MDPRIVASLTLLCLFGAALSSNPESETVQDPSKSHKNAGPKSMPLQKSDSLPGLAVISGTYSTGVRILRPVFTSLGIIWREVGDERIRIRDGGSLVDVFSRRRNNRNSSPMPAGEGKAQPDSVNISSPSIKVPQTSVSQDNEVYKGNSGTVSIPSASNSTGNTPAILPARRMRPVPGGQRNWNYGYGAKGGRRPMGHKSNVNQQNPRSPYPASSVPLPGQLGRDGVSSPASGSGKPPGNVDTSSVPPTSHAMPPDSNFFAGIVNDFTFKLVDAVQLDQLRTNFVVSPISIFVAASILYMASEGQTKAQLEQALGLNDYAVHDEHLHKGISDLLSAISPQSNELRLANGLFVGTNYSIEQPFMEDLQKFYGAELKNLDFRNHQDTSRAINEWVSKKTANMITNMATRPSLLNGILLLNAIYFKGVWKTQFPMDLTVYERFFTLDGKQREIPLMSLVREKFPVFRSEELRHTFIKLPYSGDQVSMIIALPFRHEDSPMPTVRDLTLCHIRDAMVERQLSTVAIPKFRMDYRFPLKEPLTALGVRDVFGSSADFGKMRKQKDLFVDEIIHKSVVDVNEEGTSASAATAVNFVPLSSFSDEFVANHPFAFYIVHEPSGLVLFYGKIFDLGEAPRTPASSRYQNMRVPTYNRRIMPQPSQSSRERNKS